MRHNPRTQLAGWAGLLIGALVILSSCGDDSGSINFGPSPDAPASDPLDPAPDSDPGPAGDDPTPSGVDRTGDLLGHWVIVNYSLADGGGLTNIVGSVEPFIEFAADGTLQFQTGCNGGSASWQTAGTYVENDAGFLDDTPEGQSLTITDVAKEEAACDGFLGEQDVDIAAHLGATERFRISDSGGMNLLDEFLLISGEPAS